jgi:hypothetical protein
VELPGEFGGNMKECPFCRVMPVVYDCTGDLKIEHTKKCFLKDVTWIVGKRNIQAWNTRPSPWIKASERLPDDEKLYFVLRKSPNTGYSVKIAKYFHSRMIWLTGSKEIHYVAAWCPLPELPEDINSSISQEKENKESSVLTQKEIKEAARKAGIEL